METFKFNNKEDFLLLTKEISTSINCNEIELQRILLKNRNVSNIDELFKNDDFFVDQIDEFHKQSILKEKTILWIEDDKIYFEMPYYCKYNERLIRENISDLLTKDSSLFRKELTLNFEVDDYILIRGFISLNMLRQSHLNTESIINNINAIYKESGLSLLIDSFYMRFKNNGDFELTKDDFASYNNYSNSLSENALKDIHEFFLDNIENIPDLSSNNFTKYYLSSFI